MLIVTIELLGLTVVEEAYHIVGTVAQPMARRAVAAVATLTEVVVVIPEAAGTHAHTMKHLVEQSTRALIRRLGAHTYPTAVAAVGRRRATLITHIDMEGS